MTRRLLPLTVLFGMLALAGCQTQLETMYGQRRGVSPNSVNGTAVFAGMFEQAGHKVGSWHSLSPRLQRADCIVWFPDDFDSPREPARQWLERWLSSAPGRTLIFVGRDYDAEAHYYRSVLPQAPPAQTAEIQRRLTEAERDFNAARSTTTEDREWFSVDGTSNPRKVTSLDNDPSWLSGVDPTKLDIELIGRMTPADHAKVVLSSQGDMLVSRQYIDDSQLVIVANGSFLLNLPLVNYEHRKLASYLIHQIGEKPKKVVFLESRNGDPPIRDEDPDARATAGLEILVTPPYIWVFLHVLVVAAVFCLARWPIFGQPRTLPSEATSDFSRHIRALADLLRRTRDRAFAQSRLLNYRQRTENKQKLSRLP